jgi:hypothetical protein
VKFFFQVTYLREGKVRSVRAVFDDPSKAAPWAQRIYGTNLIHVASAQGSAAGARAHARGAAN